jgi:hypothetical protein
MKKQHQILLLRISYWTGAIVDVIVAIQFLIPDFWASFNGLTTYTPNTALTFALGIASPLMFGWTFLLIWADRKPLERKGILLLTTFPVIFGIALNNVLAIASGLRPLTSAIPDLTIGIGLVALFTFSYFNASKETAQ